MSPSLFLRPGGSTDAVEAKHFLLRAGLRDILGAGNYFCELMDHGLPIERRFREDLLRIARALDLPLLATNDLHYVHAVALHRLDRDDDARRAIGEALRLNPEDEDLFSLLASIELARRNWPAALEAAEQALALNPEHVNAANLRAMALVRLGRKAEATATVDFAGA